jgi:hypothetical protein
VQRIGDDQAQVGYSVAERSGGRVTPGASVPYTRKRGVHVFWLILRTKVAWFPSLGLKIGSYDLVIWVSKSLRQFLGLGLKTKLAMVCWLRHKTDGRRTAWDTRRDLAVCLTAKQVGIGFPSLPQNRQRSDDRWCTWHHHRGHMKMKSKMDGSMQRAASDCSTPTLPFSQY